MGSCSLQLAFIVSFLFSVVFGFSKLGDVDDSDGSFPTISQFDSKLNLHLNVSIVGLRETSSIQHTKVPLATSVIATLSLVNEDEWDYGAHISILNPGGGLGDGFPILLVQRKNENPWDRLDCFFEHFGDMCILVPASSQVVNVLNLSKHCDWDGEGEVPVSGVTFDEGYVASSFDADHNDGREGIEYLFRFGSLQAVTRLDSNATTILSLSASAILRIPKEVLGGFASTNLQQIP